MENDKIFKDLNPVIMDDNNTVIALEEPKDIGIITDRVLLARKGRDITLDMLEETRECLEKMYKVMYEDKNAAGVAAQQVGYDLNAFLMKNSDNEVVCVLNPKMKLIKPSKYTFKSVEKCLSVPEGAYEVKRCSVIKTRYQDENLKYVEKRYKNIFACIFQHELDHINGILICDKGKEVEDNSINYTI